MSEHQSDELVVLVDFPPEPGVQPVGRISLSDPDQLAALQEKSENAISRSMGIVRSMAARVTKTIRDLPVSERPTEIEIEFGIKLDVEAGAMIAKSGVEAGFNVKLTWEREEKPVASLRSMAGLVPRVEEKE